MIIKTFATEMYAIKQPVLPPIFSTWEHIWGLTLSYMQVHSLLLCLSLTFHAVVCHWVLYQPLLINRKGYQEVICRFVYLATIHSTMPFLGLWSEYLRNTCRAELWAYNPLLCWKLTLFAGVPYYAFLYLHWWFHLVLNMPFLICRNYWEAIHRYGILR